MSIKKIGITEYRRVKTEDPSAVINWQIDPTTAWNYGLDIDPANPEYEMVTNKISRFHLLLSNSLKILKPL